MVSTVPVHYRPQKNEEKIYALLNAALLNGAGGRKIINKYFAIRIGLLTIIFNNLLAEKPKRAIFIEFFYYLFL